MSKFSVSTQVGRAGTAGSPSVRARALAGLATLAVGIVIAGFGAPVHGAELASAPVRSGGSSDTASFDGRVEALRQTAIAAQVSGAVVVLNVKVGDAVKPGQVLLQLDARAAQQTAAAGDAQVQAASASLAAATKEFERQTQLFKQNYISQAALDKAEAQFKATQAEVSAQRAGAGAAHTASGFYVVKAPYAGIVSDVAVVLGDMAMPGKPLLTVYDPAALRVSVDVPQTATARITADAVLRVELPGLPADRQWVQPRNVQWLPTVDPATHTLELRLDLPASLPGVAPGMFARAWLPAAGAGAVRLFVPQQAIVQRAELTALYVIAADGRPMLRQVRVGRSADGQVEVLAGVSAGERVALDPQAAARVR